MAAIVYLACALLLPLLAAPVASQPSLNIKGVCSNLLPIVAGRSARGCGVPSIVNITEFGDNSRTNAFLRLVPSPHSLRFQFRVTSLSSPRLVLTAWLLYVVPGASEAPDIFNITADAAAPVAPTTAAFTSGLAPEPNQLTYISSQTATLTTTLDFNPTYADEGPLTFRGGHTQRFIRGIQRTPQRQPPFADTLLDSGNFLPVASSYLRTYDPDTGFELKDDNGRPQLVRSPVPAPVTVIVAHVDRATHGLSPGVFGADHFDLFIFPLPQRMGSPLASDLSA